MSEPTVSETIDILKGLRDKYEVHHKVKISEEAISAAAKLSARYITQRFLPDKAIDLIDEACSSVRLKASIPPIKLKELDEKAKLMSREKGSAIRGQEYEKAAHFRDEEKRLRTEYEKLKTENIYARKYFYPLTNSFECYKGRFDVGKTPVAKYIADRVLTLPLYADLALDNVDRICDIILR